MGGRGRGLGDVVFDTPRWWHGWCPVCRQYVQVRTVGRRAITEILCPGCSSFVPAASCTPYRLRGGLAAVGFKLKKR